MPAPSTLPEFLDLVRKSGLIAADRLEESIARSRTGTGVPQTIEALSQMLVREGLLSFFQSKQLKLGRYKRFTIGTKYRLLELLGSGGMGAVYLCEHTLMKRLVALKVLPVDKLDDPSSLERFYREARAVAALNHPNIVRAHDIDQYDKLHFLVMEFVDGSSLQEIVARHGPMDPVRVAHYVAQSAVGLQHAHELGMVHRDIKPGNLLLDRTGVIKVLDMGLARFFNKSSDNVTEKYDDKCVLGTADYLAPEQAVSNNVDVRADIYSLGGTMYFMLTGQTPFPDGSIASKLVAHQTRNPKPVEEYRPDVPSGVLEVLYKMMAKDPNDRYQTPIEVAVALAEWAEAPIGPPSPRQMPVLCPAVLALAGHSADMPNAGQLPLSRVLFGPGQGVFARTGSGSAGRTRGSAAKGAIGKVPAVGTGGQGSARTPAAKAPPACTDEAVPINGPVSTGRTSAMATAPLKSRGQKASDSADGIPLPAPVPDRSGWLGGFGILSRGQLLLFLMFGLLLFVAGALVVYLATKA